jgi:ABC-type bacteriocin/lantibiotic exporter with double-glycine peptidase domain
MVANNQKPTRIEILAKEWFNINPTLTSLTLYLGVIAVLFLATKTALQASISFKSMNFTSRIETEIATDLYRKIVGSSVANSQSNSISEYQFSLLIGPNRFVVGMLGTFIALVSDAFSIALMSAFVLYASPISFLLSFGVFCIIYGLINGPIHRKAKSYGERSSELYAELNSQINEDISGIREVKIYGQENYVVANFSKLRREWALLNQKMFWINNVIRYFLEISVLIIGVLVLTVLGLTTDLRHAVTVLVAFLAVGFRLLPNVQRIQNSIISLRIAEGATKDLFNFSESLKILPREQISTKKGLELKSIVAEELVFNYPNGNFSLGPISFEITAKTTNVILGTSGSGKSTLLDLICKLNAPSSGKVNFISTSGDLLEMLPTIGFVSQRSSLFGIDLIQNIGFARPKEDVDLVRVKNVMSLINLSEFSEGKGRVIRSDGTDVSGGERQRISMARVMYCDPDIVVLDEPTSSLDPVNRVKIYEFLEEMHGKKTVIVVTHEKELIDFSDYVLEIKQGKVSFQGSTAEYKRIQ